MALELVCGAGFSCELMCGAGPGDLRGSRGSVSAENPGRTGPKISSHIAFRYPAGDQTLDFRARQRALRPRPPAVHNLQTDECRPDLQIRYLKAVWLEIFGPVFHGCPAETDPRDPPRSPGLAPHINFRENSAPQTTSKAISRHPKIPARLPSGTESKIIRQLASRRPQ